MIWRYLLVAAIACGAAFYLYIYHVRVARISLENRKQVIDWPFYQWIDVYLKLSSLGISFAAILVSHDWFVAAHHSLTLASFGASIAGIGIMLFVWAMYSLDHQFSNAHQAHLPTRLVAAGPYHWIRHPIYTANVLQTFGLMVASGSAWLLLNLAIVVAYYAVMVPREEGFLLQEFPDYADYRKRTGAIFPRLIRTD